MVEQHLAFGRAFAHGVVAVVGAVEVAVGCDVQTVRSRERALAPGAQEIPRPIEHDHRVGAAIEHIYPVIAVDADGRDILEIPAVGQAAPAFRHAVRERARADDNTCRAIGCPCRRDCIACHRLSFRVHSRNCDVVATATRYARQRSRRQVQSPCLQVHAGASSTAATSVLCVWCNVPPTHPAGASMASAMPPSTRACRSA